MANANSTEVEGFSPIPDQGKSNSIPYARFEAGDICLITDINGISWTVTIAEPYSEFTEGRWGYVVEHIDPPYLFEKRWSVLAGMLRHLDGRVGHLRGIEQREDNHG